MARPTSSRAVGPRRLTIRVRLTLSYAGLITGAGAVLIAVVYLYMRFVPSYRVVPDPGADLAEAAALGRAQPTDGISITSADDFLDNLLVASALALLVMAVLGGVAGWLVAGRIVRPLGEIGAAARRAASGALDHRVALSGPPDEVRDLADTFDGMLASLERAFAAQRRFTANASHELQSPLATIKTMIDVLEPEAGTGAYRDLVRRISEVNQSSIETVDALLDLATAGSVRGPSGALDVAALARAVTDRHAADAVEAGVGLDCSGPGTVVLGDVVLVRQALSNLVRNAIRHNYRGGTASVRVDAVGECGRVTVVNTGPPVREADLEILTEPFARGSGRRLTRGGGHGLGLAIVRAAVEAQDGALTLRSRPGGGLCVSVDLPLAAPGAAPGAGSGV